MDHSSKILTIIICTYNRNEILDLCLRSLERQTVDTNQFDVLVVNNYTDLKNTRKLEEILSKYKNVTLIHEPRAGLSIARNTGARYAQTKWVGYIDDDCKAHSDFIKQALEIIKKEKYDCFGGDIKSWWLYEKPRWLKHDHGSKPKLSSEEIVLNEDFNWGGNIFFDREKLLEVGGFNVNIGMREDKIGYSAENRVQIEMQKGRL